jgi:hypothetical protein
MTTYYTSTTTGNDTTGDGLSPSTAWATINKALSTMTSSGSGDLLKIAPGVYWETAGLSMSPTSSSPLTIQGDDGSSFGMAKGFVDWRAWTNNTTPKGTNTLTVSGKSYVTLKNLKMTGGNGQVISTSNDCTNWTIQDCILIGYGNNQCIQFVGTTGGVAMNLTLERCDLHSNTNLAMTLYTPKHTAEYSVNALIRNCNFYSRSTALNIQSVGSGSFLATGITVKNCGFHYGNVGFGAYGPDAINLTTPISVMDCWFHGCQTGLSANNTTQIAEDYNTISAVTVRTNVSTGTHSITTFCPAFSANDERLNGEPLRPFWEPSASSPLLAWHTDGSTPSVDLYNQNRPATAAAGPLERDAFSTGTTTNYIFQVEG